MDHRTKRLRLAPRASAHAAGLALRRQRIPEELAASLRERILSGELSEGSVLRQEAIAAQYHVSRIPVREALRLLDGEGLVDLRHAHRGAVVAALSAEQVGELFDLRAMLERDLVVRAVPLTTAAELARAEEILRKVDAAYDGDDPHAWGALNAEFHRALYLPARREQTIALVESINLLTQRAIRLYHRLTTSFGQARAEHWEILRLVQARKADQAGAALDRHVQRTKQALVAILEGRRAPSAGAGRAHTREQRP